MKKLFLLLIATLLLAGCTITITAPAPGIIPVNVPVETGSLMTVSPTPSPLPSSLPSASGSLIPQSGTGSLLKNFHIPILMYHHIGTYPKNADQIRRNLTLSTKSFESQLKILGKKEYQAITFYDLEAYMDGKENLPKKPIILTFDDGYDDNYANAFPLLNQYHQKAIFYIITDKAETPGYMTWEQIKNLHSLGHEIGSHTRTHVDLKQISYDNKKLEQEVVESKKILEDKDLGPIISFCYPSGAFNEKVVNLAEENYHFSRTTLSGIFTSNSPRGKLPVLRMQEGVDLNMLLQ